MSEIAAAAAEVEEALEALRAAEAAAPWNPDALGEVSAATRVALALGRFEVPDDRDGPCVSVAFGSTPTRPEAPMFPAFGEARTQVEPRVAALMEALEALQAELVWQADRAEFTDARNTSIQYLRAAGYLERAAAKLVEYGRHAAPPGVDPRHPRVRPER